MATNDNLFPFLQNQMQALLDSTRDLREELVEIRKEMVSRTDLKDYKDSFSDKIEEVQETLKSIEDNLEVATERLDILEVKEEKSTEFVKNFKGALKWFFLSVATTCISATASLIPYWISHSVQNANITKPAIVQSVQNSQPTTVTDAHSHMKVIFNH